MATTPNCMSVYIRMPYPRWKTSMEHLEGIFYQPNKLTQTCQCCQSPKFIADKWSSHCPGIIFVVALIATVLDLILTFSFWNLHVTKDKSSISQRALTVHEILRYHGGGFQFRRNVQYREMGENFKAWSSYCMGRSQHTLHQIYGDGKRAGMDCSQSSPITRVH